MCVYNYIIYFIIYIFKIIFKNNFRTQISLEFVILLPLSPKYWKHRHALRSRMKGVVLTRSVCRDISQPQACFL